MTLLRWVNKVPRWAASAMAIAAVLYLTLAPKPLPDNDMHLWQHTDKVVHSLMMSAVYLSLCFDIWRGKKVKTRYKLLLVTAVAAFGGAIELAQMAMDMGRGASWGDFAADCAGASIAALLSLRVKQ